jgi:predicted dehydrogenase
MKTMRLAVLGLGFMGSTHIKALRSIPGVELAAVFSSDSQKLAGDLSGIQGNLGGPGEQLDFSQVSKYSNIDSLLADPSIDAVDICLPTDLHAPVATQAIRAGKHVLVEKPIALDGATAHAIIAGARTHNRILMAAQVLRFFPMYEALRERLADPATGQARWAMFRRRCAAPAWSKWLQDAHRSGGGVFDLLIHDVDMCLHLFGKPASVAATGYEAMATGVDLIAGELRYASGLTAIVTGGWHHPKSYPFSMEYTVSTDGGTFEYSSAGRAPRLYRADGVEEILPLADRDGYAAEIAYFAECCRTGEPPRLCPPEESAQAVALTNLLLESRKNHGEILACTI